MNQQTTIQKCWICQVWCVVVPGPAVIQRWNHRQSWDYRQRRFHRGPWANVRRARERDSPRIDSPRIDVAYSHSEMLDLSGFGQRLSRVSVENVGQRTPRSRKGTVPGSTLRTLRTPKRTRAHPSAPERTRCASPGAVSRQTNRAFRWTRQDLILINSLTVVARRDGHCRRFADDLQMICR